jgi:hypothetical protein
VKVRIKITVGVKIIIIIVHFRGSRHGLWRQLARSSAVTVIMAEPGLMCRAKV